MAANIPYSRDFTLTVAGGTPSTHELKFPHRGTLRSIAIKSVNGGGATGAGLSIGLYSANQLTPGSPDNTRLLWSATPSGDTHNTGNIDIAYTNREGSPSNPVSKLYAVITAGGSGTKTVTVSLTCDVPTNI